jgi:hypothetical protein
MNHHPSDDSANVPSLGQAAVADVRDGDSLPLGSAPGDAEPSVSTSVAPEHRESYQIDPLLQKALSCLDIKLADELARFRSTQGQQMDKSDLDTRHDSSDRQRDRSANNSVSWEQQGADFDADSNILTAEIIQPPTANENSAPKGGFIIIDGLTTSASSSRNANVNSNYAPIALHRSDEPAIAENLDLNFSSGGEMAQFHDKYLSSSQELLRQIQSGYPTDESAQPAPNPRPKHFTPLKVGSMAVICALAGGAVYTYLNPSILAPLTAAKVATPTATTPGQLIQSPNLAASEFTEINLSTLNTIKLPTVAAANVTTTPAAISVAPTNVSTAPAAIPFNGMRPTSQTLPTTTITSQPRLADSLVKSLLPPNFHSFTKPSGYRTTPPIGR